MNIPLEVVNAGKTYEYVSLTEEIEELRKAKSRAYERCTQMMDSLKDIVFYQSGRNHTFIHPTSIKPMALLVIREVANNMIEDTQRYAEISQEYEDARTKKLNLQKELGIENAYA
jgi:nitrogen fixation/metabolism regulation signal transduction histidine kinase